MAQEKDQRKVHGGGNIPMPYKRTIEKLMVKEIAPCPFESKTFDEVCEVQKEKALALRI
jgi:hypothetical protein